MTIFLVLLLVAATASVGEARTAEVHVVQTVDLERVQQSGPPDEPLEPAPSLQQRARDLVAAHPAFRSVTLRVLASRVPPNPRVPADFLRLVNQRVDELVVVNLGYYLRLDNFRGTGVAGIRGLVAVYSVSTRRQVVSRTFTVSVSYPGDVTKEAVLQAEVTARARGAPIPIEQVEVNLLDAAVKQRFERELNAALVVYHPPSLPQVSMRSIQDAMERLGRFLLESPDRRLEAIQVLDDYLQRYPDAPQRAEIEGKLRQLRQAGGPDPKREAERQRERAANRVSRTLTAAELAGTFERLVGSVVEVRAFKLWDWSPGSVMMTPETGTAEKSSDFLVDEIPDRKRLDSDPPAIYVKVLERRVDPRIPGVDVKISVIRWVGCPSTACPSSP